MSDQRRPTKAVIPAAGLGTRFLPATKAIPKELLPVVDIPAMEYIVAEAAGVGLTDVLVITARGKEAIADHFDRAPELEAALEKKGDADRLAALRRSAELADVHFVRQGAPRGLGHAILCADAFVGDEVFAVLLGDDLVDERDPLLQPMLDVQAEHGGCVVALMEVPRHSVSLYGCVAAEPTGTDGVVRVTDLVEKPAPEDAPSNLAIIGRYVLAPSIFDTLRQTEPGRGGEIQITDALRRQAMAGEPMHGVVFRGRRYDTGDKADYLKAVVRLACERPDLGPEFRQWLEDFVAGRA
ncbi:MAG: UTP--glucose-1-phosphate uridylyltransferase [uncultured Corynebacteriales bacterium]|uniref:UTP--glucose-1-phosphate uridylyltransferase n=1 Tax=uncultured Mycobacteriales bacterium TaxID=581187 RepID=A0A6J4IFD7_9ACTN|nr:MAG: UTP--glucose-1-phosphate uridylyltransferase [uncultured Corynebacteriales bacterium]